MFINRFGRAAFAMVYGLITGTIVVMGILVLRLWLTGMSIDKTIFLMILNHALKGGWTLGAVMAVLVFVGGPHKMTPGGR